MMKIGGLASGMNTDDIIRDLMKAQSIPLDKITQRKQFLEWQLNDYRSVNRDLDSMSKKLLDTVLMEGSYMAKNVNISNPDAVGIKSINANSEFSGSISVHQLATQATWQSGGSAKDLDENAVLDPATRASLGITGSEIIIKAPDSKGGVTETKIEIESTDTMKSLLDKINKGTGGVNAFYDSASGQIAMTANNSGKGEISVENLAGKSQAGQNAEFTFNGLKTERTSNTFQISGFEINLKQVTAPFEVDGDGNPKIDENTGKPIIASGGAAVTFNSSPDTDKVMDMVVKFVDDYNKMIEELHKKVGEGKNRDFPPLSDAQKKDMTEKEIEQWEEKAMSGTLRNDPAIQKLLTGMRGALNGSIPYTKDDGTEGKLFLSDIGITTATDWRDNGKLVINPEKLRQAITDDPNKVYEMFGKSAAKDKDGKVTYEGGLGVRLRAAIDEGVKSLSSRAGKAGDVNDKFALGNSMKDMESQIARFQERLKASEDRLWKQFAAMEMSIQRSNAQSAQLMSTFGGGM